MYCGKLDKNIKKINSLLIEVFVEYYGEEYRRLIVEKINSISYVFRTDPNYEYYVVKVLGDLFTEEEKNVVIKDYKEYEKIEMLTKKNSREALEDYIALNFSEFNLDKEELKNLSYLFANSSFEETCIDSFGSSCLNALVRNDISDVIKESIIKDQNKFLSNFSKYSVTKETMKSICGKVDELIKFRNMLKEGYHVEVVENSEVGKEIKKIIEENIGRKVDTRDITGFFIKKELCALTWSEYRNDTIETGCVLKAPFTLMRTFSKDFADENFIHEIIHAIESCEGVGIMDGWGNNRILNEVRTQMLAKKISKNLHDEGVYIFEDSLDHPLDEEKSLYEYMFPFVENFFNKHENELKITAIKNSPWMLERIFGDKWREFSNRIDEIYNFMSRKWEYGVECGIPCDKKCEQLIEEMEKHYIKKTGKR